MNYFIRVHSACRSGWCMSGKASPSSIQGLLSGFVRIMVTETLKTPYRLLTVTLKLSLRVKKTKHVRKEKPKVTKSVALVMAFPTAENENRELEDLPQADFGRVSERFLLSVRTKSMTENFYIKITLIVCFCSFSTRFFLILSVSANALYVFFTRIIDPFIFIT